MISEADIRNQTNSILSGYQDLITGSYVPSLPEYLELRRQAEQELRSGICGRNEDAAVRSIPAAKPTVPVRKESMPYPVRQESFPAAPVVQSSASVPAAPENVTTIEVPQEPESDFEILRRLGDPWNS